MRSANSFFNVALFKKQTRRFAPLWVSYTALLLILFPLILFLKAQNAMTYQLPVLQELHNYIITFAADAALWVAFIAAIVAAMAIWSYLYNNRSVSMIHALPLSRGTLFATNYITGLLFLIVPNILAFLVGLGVEAALGAVTIQPLLQWLLVQSALNFIFFSFATLMAFVTGHILVLPVLYGVFSILTMALEVMIDTVLSTFVYGYSGGTIPLVSWLGKWLSPLRALGLNNSNGLGYTYPTDLDPPGDGLVVLHGLPSVGIYAVAALFMVALAYLIYRRRKLELSGEVITVSFLRPVFKYGVAVCAGLSFGVLFYQIVYGVRVTYSFGDISTGQIGPMLLALLVFAAIGYFAAEIMLRKTVRVLRKGWPGCLVLLLVLSALLLGMEYDLSGYEKKLPNESAIASVSIYDLENVDPAQALALHRALVEQKGEIESCLSRFEKENWRDASRYQTRTINSVNLRYVMLDGSVFSRNYVIPIYEEFLARDDSPATLYQKLQNNLDVRKQRTLPDSTETADLIETSLELPGELKADRNGKGYSSTTRKLTVEEGQRVYRAVREDLEAGRIGRQDLLYNEESMKTNYDLRIYFSFRGEYNRENIPSKFSFSGKEPPPAGLNAPAYFDTNITVQTDSTATLKVLAELGLHPGVDFETQAEQYERVMLTEQLDRSDTIEMAPEMAP